MKKSFSINKDLKNVINKLFPNKNDHEYIISELKTLYDHYSYSKYPIGDRIFAAVLKLSEGNIENFNRSIDLAKFDWRDLLIEAKFAEDTKIHKKWIIENI